MKKILFRLFSCFVVLVACGLSCEIQSFEPAHDSTQISSVLSRSDHLPGEIEHSSDSYFEGYVQALVDVHYHEHRVIVIARDHNVWLLNLPKNQLTANSIVAFVRDVPGVKEVKTGSPPRTRDAKDKHSQDRPQLFGIWFPQSTELFQPLVADPRQVTYTIGYRRWDEVMGPSCIAISLGENFPIYRWLALGGYGDLQIGIEAGIWSVFNLAPHPNIADGVELVNTDFYFGIPVAYAVNKWAIRARIYHISSHLGDEYMVNHPNVVRLNPSMEAVDCYVSYQAMDILRVYVGPGIIAHSDPSFPMKPPFYVQYGAELRWGGQKFHSQRLFGTFFLAAHIRNMQFLHWDFDETIRMGYEFSKLAGIGRKLRLFIGYHHGFSLEGQFQKERTQYGEFSLAYGF